MEEYLSILRLRSFFRSDGGGAAFDVTVWTKDRKLSKRSFCFERRQDRVCRTYFIGTV